jgi:AcrR family transcriptional regulator
MPRTAAPSPPDADAPLELKEACVRAAQGFIAEHGVERLSLREVARRLGVSHQAPYKHYPSRDHLLAEVMRRCFRQFAAYLDDRGTHADPREDLGALGRRYLAFAAAHPLEYRLMFGTPWPAGSEHAGLAAEARHALDVLRAVLRRIHGDARSQKVRVDLDAMFIWSQMHGLASIAHADVMAHLDLMPQAGRNMVPHAMEMMGRALDGDAPAPSD